MCSNSLALMAMKPNYCISFTRKITQLRNLSPFPSALRSISGTASLSTSALAQTDVVASHIEAISPTSSTEHQDSIFSGLGGVMAGYIQGKHKATVVAQTVWKHVVRKGDLVIDATCGKGHDTLALLRLVADDAGRGRVLAMDLQKDALERTSSLLDQSVSLEERQLVQLYPMCHTKMEEIVPDGDKVRLVAFNLGYLPGSDKEIKTEAETTRLALDAATKILDPGGLISVVAYVGHAGGRKELQKVQSFAANLPTDKWACCKLQVLNKPLAPVIVLLSKKSLVDIFLQVPKT